MLKLEKSGGLLEFVDNEGNGGDFVGQFFRYFDVAVFFDEFVKIFSNFDVLQAVIFQSLEVAFLVVFNSIEAVAGFADTQICLSKKIQTNALTVSQFYFFE